MLLADRGFANHELLNWLQEAKWHYALRLPCDVNIHILFATTQGMAVQIQGLRQQVDPHWKRGLSYLKIGLRWLKGVLNKGRTLLPCLPLLSQDPQPCFASKKAMQRVGRVRCG